MKTYKEFKIAIKIGKTIEDATIIVKYEGDGYPIDVDFGTDKEDQDYAKRFESGNDLVNICIAVEAFWNGFNGSDYLGDCHIDTSQFDTNLEEVVSDHSMIEQALEDLKSNMMADIERIKPLLEQTIDVQYGQSK